MKHFTKCSEKNRNFPKKVTTDIVWSISALVLLNGVLQFLVYPILNRHLKEKLFGDVLYILGILAVFAPAIGLAANNTRLLEKREYSIENGDILCAILPQISAAELIFLPLIFPYTQTPGNMFLAACLLLFTALRYYGDVEYRLTLHYKGYFGYYAIITCGYILGLLLYPITKSWISVFLLGEIACSLLLLWRGHIYRPIKYTEQWRKVSARMGILTLSYLFSNIMLNLDRILLKHLIGSEEVTIYYVASLLGKTTALLVGPLNGVFIGYLSKYKAKITADKFLKIVGILVASAAVLFAGILVIMPTFVRLFYANIAEKVLNIAVYANLSQVMYFVSSLLLTIMLTFSGGKWQLLIQSVSLGLFLLLGILGASSGGVFGFILGGLITNLIKFFLIVLITEIQLVNKGYQNKVSRGG